MKILDFMSKEEFQEYQDLFSDATGLAAIALDAEGNYISEGSNFNDFCMKYTRGTKKGAERCLHDDETGVGCYYCHAGLMDFGEDIKIGDEVVGRIIGGQVLPNPPDDDKFRRIAEELGIDPEAYVKAVHKVPVKTEKSIKASAKLLAMLINRIVNDAYEKRRTDNIVNVVKPELEKTTEDIQAIVGLVKKLDGIASKQNILTLNASIESARAGEAGRGFAVVAQQMGDMTRTSSELYKSIDNTTKSLSASIKKMDDAF